jgi:peptide/nickel transport system substrate-binding protein
MNTYSAPSRLVILMLAGLFFLAACQPPATAAPGTGTTTAPTSQPEGLAPAPGATGDTNAISAAILLDPALAEDADSLKICQYLYDGLVRLDANGKAQPALAASWVISDDQLDYIFTIRPAAVFSDGTPITPDVVVDNFNRWFDPVSSQRADRDFLAWKNIFLGFDGEKGTDGRPLSPVDGIQKVDNNTVLIHLNRPVPELLTDLANPAFAVLSPAAFAENGYGSYPTPVVASGPYIVSSWTETILLLTPNPAYWTDVPLGDLQFKLH